MRISKKISLLKSVLLCIPIIGVFLFSISTLSFDTYSYFNAKLTGSASIKSAVEKELVTITTGEIDYSKQCKAEVPVTIENIFDYKVIILFDQKEYTIQPGEKIMLSKVVANSCKDYGNKTFNIIGYDHYFIHPITVMVDKSKLNPCPEPAVDHAKGDENDNGLGKHCGDEGNHESSNKSNSEDSEKPIDSANSDAPTTPINPQENTNKTLIQENEPNLENQVKQGSQMTDTSSTNESLNSSSELQNSSAQ